VDLVVSGHTHQAYNCALPNSKGRSIPVTSTGAFSRLMTRIDLTLDTRSKDVIAVQAENKLVDRNNVLGAAEPIMPVAAISQIVANYNALASPSPTELSAASRRTSPRPAMPPANRPWATWWPMPSLPPWHPRTKAARSSPS